MNRYEKGSLGESIAEKYLKKHGYKIIEKNYRASKLAEIDIIAINNGVTVFVEVKLRESIKRGLGREAVTPKKQQHIRYAAQHYMCTVLKKEVECRFDVVEITFEGTEADIKLIKNAF